MNAPPSQRINLRQCAGAVRRAQERQKLIAAGRSVKALFGLSAEELDLVYLGAAARKLEYLMDFEDDIALLLRLSSEQRATMRAWGARYAVQDAAGDVDSLTGEGGA